jgi:hypothetical protein
LGKTSFGSKEFHRNFREIFEWNFGGKEAQNSYEIPLFQRTPKFLINPKKIRLPYLSLKILKSLINHHSYLLFLNYHRHLAHGLTVLNTIGKDPFTPGCFSNGVMSSIFALATFTILPWGKPQCPMHSTLRRMSCVGSRISHWRPMLLL